MQFTISSTHTPELNDDAAILAYFESKHPWGISTSIDLIDCNPNIIRSEERIRSFVNALCTFINMKKFGPCIVVDFGKEPRVAGFSMTQLIETSLISAHFSNASNAAYLDIFSCAPYPPYSVARFAQGFFEAKEIRVAVIIRG